MENILSHKTDNQRRLCIHKDFKELSLWISELEKFNEKLDCFSVIEKQLIHSSEISNAIKTLRRKNVLVMAVFYKYNQDLKNEFEYGETEYDVARSKIHEVKREQYKQLLLECDAFEKRVYKILMKYQRK